MSKPRFDSVLFQLSPERQAQVFDWVARHGYLETAKKITAPEGFGLVTHACEMPNLIWIVARSGTLNRNPKNSPDPEPGTDMTMSRVCLHDRLT